LLHLDLSRDLKGLNASGARDFHDLVRGVKQADRYGDWRPQSISRNLDEGDDCLRGGIWPGKRPACTEHVDLA
jgi:hypothetical protein